ncbi:hypothetical protein F383_22872 [Gossypium arboreum]|uniref:Uncharacterized protein n=1 Tax=Gossypium arboreum TaxID=29729 RepID=A0A0B0NVY4_GOSAR|nr:hypothetical protein F383_22872 [Gossypium arboreum]
MTLSTHLTIPNYTIIVTFNLKLIISCITYTFTYKLYHGRMYIYSYTYTHESKYNITYIFIAYGRIYYTNAHIFTLVTCII